MTDLDDKTLDELVSRADAMTDYDPLDTSEQSVREFASDCYNKITALRARVEELEEDREKLCEALTEQSRIGLRWAREARQVTREQRDSLALILTATRNASHMEQRDYDAADKIIKNVLNLEIVEDAPKAEGRECGCPVYDKHGDANQYSVEYYDCARCNGFVTTRCTFHRGRA